MVPMDATPITEVPVRLRFSDAERRLAEKLPGYEPRVPQTQLAEAMERTLAEPGQVLIAEAGTGCIYGDAEIAINRGGNGKTIKLRDLVVRQNGGRTKGQQKFWDPEIPTYVQREAEDGTIRLGRLSAAWCSGWKRTFTMVTHTGRSIRATDEHPFLTERGWLRLDQLTIGDQVHVRGEQASTDRTSKPVYRAVYRMHSHPYAIRRKNGSACSWEHRLAAEAAQNGMETDEFIGSVIAGRVDGLTFLDPTRFAVHHLDGDSTNNDQSNLKVMSHREHHIEHSLVDSRNVLYKVTTERVVAVTEYGFEETYDIEVEDDPHNFLANGFVVHNTGKSFASLIPAILSGKRVVFATATKALQDQIRDKDLPFLEETLGVPFSWTVLKGRSNYACVAKLDDPETIAEVGGIAAIREVIELHANVEGWFGEREQFRAMTDAEWRSLTMSSDECPGKSDCPWGGECLAEKAKREALESDVVVVNQALLMIDAHLGATTDRAANMLGEYDALIVDEAHELEDWATGALTARFTVAGVLNLMGRVSNAITKANGDLPLDISTKIEAIRSGIVEIFEGFERSHESGGRIYLGDMLQREDEWFEIITAMIDIETQLGNIIDRFSLEGRDSTEGRRQRRQLQTAHRRMASMRGRIVDLLTTPESDLVRWLTIEDRTDRRGRQSRVVILESAPVSVASFMAAHMWRPERSYALISATISVDKTMEYVAGRLGITSWDELLVGTPFDYPNQAGLYIPGNLPIPSGQSRGAWELAAANEMVELIRASGGGALVLFTSRKSMQSAYSRLTEALPEIDFRCQGEAPNPTLLDWFKSNTNGCLLATRSFMTGVDVPGESLRLLILDKLPFPTPTDPMVEARCEALDNAKDGSSFMGYTVPVMTLILQQAVGRLVRTRSDRGVMAILDPRLVTKGYGTKIVRSLPPARRLNHIGEVAAMFD